MSRINQIFDAIEDWKKFPAYRAEPRIDWLVGSYLDEILGEYLQVEVSGVIPEFPLRVGTIYPNHEHTDHADRSYKVDFYAKLTNNNNVLVEFKTDSSSRRDKQDHYLMRSSECGMKRIVEGIVRISDVSPYKIKYKHLLLRLETLGLVSLPETKRMVTVDCDSISVVYIQPNVHNNSTTKNSISFDYVSRIIEKHSDEFSKRLAQCLRKWSGD